MTLARCKAEVTTKMQCFCRSQEQTTQPFVYKCFFILFLKIPGECCPKGILVYSTNIRPEHRDEELLLYQYLRLCLLLFNNLLLEDLLSTTWALSDTLIRS